MSKHEATTMFVRVLQVLDAVYSKLSTPERLKLAFAFSKQKSNPKLNQNEIEELWTILNKQEVIDDLKTVQKEKVECELREQEKLKEVA